MFMKKLENNNTNKTLPEIREINESFQQKISQNTRKKQVDLNISNQGDSKVKKTANCSNNISKTNLNHSAELDRQRKNSQCKKNNPKMENNTEKNKCFKSNIQSSNSNILQKERTKKKETLKCIYYSKSMKLINSKQSINLEI